MQGRLVRDGVELAYRCVGNGPDVVMLVHGWMMSGAVYDDLAEAFGGGAENRYRLVIPDLRGAGQSEKPESGYTLAAYAADVLAVADAVGARSFVLVGHSMGGQLAQWIASSAPRRVRGAMLLCPVPASGMALPEEAKALFRNSGGNRQAQETILGMACKDLSASARERLLDVAGAIPASCIEETFDAWTGGGFAERLGAIRTPTLVVATDDPFLPPDFLRNEIVAHIRNAELSYLPGAGHYVQVERPRETAALLRAFLAGLSG
ncbi:alpha/beta fold hydrolase [Chondromyces crocatus]|uniref:Alpha/beta hydrolase n=1 Tax=Chondromyces crocatus TaxID=52 RepID=A0A0K1ERT3_CHOCO|nr:alpha/beta hydrolase [Chondromyces crocatus]AKT43328.1 alpha/beta hydrolase [Chondromyces crocatus]